MQPHDDDMDRMIEGLRDGYNPPPATPRDEMWAAIEAHLQDRASSDVSPVISLDAERMRRASALNRGPRRHFGWAVAAAAVLVLGIGIGRMSAPVPATAPAAAGPSSVAMRMAAVEHLGRTESLLTVVRADARAGRMEPETGAWARGLLAQTRLLLDAPGEKDPAMKQLLEDLELVLVQIVGVTDSAGHDAARTRTELNLALKGLDERDVLPRIQAVMPAGAGMSGT